MYLRVKTFVAGGLAATALVIGLGVIAPADRAAAQGTWTGSSSPEDLLYRLDILDAELADIRARLGGVAAPRTGTGVPLSGDAGAMEAEIQRLTAALERVELAQRQLSADLTRRLGDIEFRLNELEGNPGGGDIQPLAGGNLTGPTVGQGPLVSVSEQGDLDRAVGDVKQGRFDQAEDRLRRFIGNYPGSPLLGDAWYWLGESQSVRGNHADAASSYLKGFQSDTQGQRAAHNLYRLGATLGRLGQLNEACLTLREVRNRFPNAPDGIPAKADAEADALTC